MKRYTSYKPSGVPWLGDVPAHWKVNRLKEISRLFPSNVDKLTVEGQPLVKLCNYVDVYRNESITSTIDFMEATATSEQIDKLRLRRGDVVVTKDSESPWDIAVPTLIAEEIDGLVCGYHLTKLEPLYVHGRFLAWALRCYHVNVHFALNATGITRYGLGSSALADGNIPLPPPEEQQAIADYLDAETTRIDTLIHEKDELIGLLKEWRQSMIAEVVTKGLDKTVPMKPAGVPWLGDVPAHWLVAPLKFFLKSLSGGNAIKNTVAHEDGPGLFPAFSASGQDVWMEDYEFDSPGIVVSAVGARCGKTFRANGQWGTVANTHVLLLADGSCRDYFWYLTNDENFWDKGGTAQPFVKVSSTLARKVAVPPPDEQQAIADYLDTETAKIDALIAHAKDDIVLLKELRAATIADAVLGRIDVRTH